MTHSVPVYTINVSLSITPSVTVYRVHFSLWMTPSVPVNPQVYWPYCSSLFFAAGLPWPRQYQYHRPEHRPRKYIRFLVLRSVISFVSLPTQGSKLFFPCFLIDFLWFSHYIRPNGSTERDQLLGTNDIWGLCILGLWFVLARIKLLH